MSIELSGVSKAYGRRAVLRDLTFRVHAGEVYGLLGPNGSGKTTTINVLCGLLQPDSGVASVEGEALTRDRRARIGIVPQEISLYRHLTCRENLRLFADLYGFGGRKGADRIARVIDEMQLGEYADTPVAELSGGWLRRVNIAASILHGPRALVLDEPTAGLDVEARQELWELVHRLQAADVAILLTTHQLEEAERLCTRVGILGDGRIVAEGTLEELRARIPASHLAEIQTDDEDALQARAESLGWHLRRYGARRTLWLPRPMALPELVTVLDGCRLHALAIREIGLEHVYLEATAEARGV
jgi:ABC-2 type transport system ATP-binding protein